MPKRLLTAIPVVLAVTLLGQPLAVWACAVTGAQAYQANNREVALAMEKAVIAQLGAGYPALPQMEVGYPNVTKVAAAAPCVLVKAIGYVEASWRQAAGSVRDGATGPVKQSASCGYGIMQITSGMRNAGELPADTQLRIASDYQYNIGWGVMLLTEKWNAMDFFDAVIGNRDPSIAESWYYSVWAYNQFNFRNNPNNPDYAWPRPAFDGTQSRLNYPYQELVFGFAANPPLSGGAPMWEAVAVGLPDRDKVGMTPGPLPTPANPHSPACKTLYTDPGSIALDASAGLTSVKVAVHSAMGPGANAWRAEVSGGGWVSVSPTTGSTLPAELSVAIDPRSLPGGRQRAQVTITGPTGATPAVLSIEVSVGASSTWYFPYLPRRALAPH